MLGNFQALTAASIRTWGQRCLESDNRTHKWTPCERVVVFVVEGCPAQSIIQPHVSRSVVHQGHERLPCPHLATSKTELNKKVETLLAQRNEDARGAFHVDCTADSGLVDGRFRKTTSDVSPNF